MEVVFSEKERNKYSQAMNYDQTLDFLFSQLPMFQNEGKSAIKKSLRNIISLCNHLDNPQNSFKTIHVAGTNGKGSVSHMLSSVLTDNGYRCGLYTSPHLLNFTERIKINGEECDQNFIVDFVAKNQKVISHVKPSFFEITVAMAFQYFHEQGVQVAVIETGLGGRLDSTNIINPILSIITSIGIDHQDLLGETIEEIAGEKAGIIKRNVPVVIGHQLKNVTDVLTQFAENTGADVYITDKAELELVTAEEQVIKVGSKSYSIDLMGQYQRQNLPIALKAIDILKTHDFNIPNIENGLKNVIKNTSFRGRWDRIVFKNRQFIADIGHNEDGIRQNMQQLQILDKKCTQIIFGTVSDKKHDDILKLLPRGANYYFVKPTVIRGLDAKVLQQKAAKFKLVGQDYASIEDALHSALLNCAEDETIFIGGSTFLVADFLRHLQIN
ncbi:MAG: dihydrofolate synthase/folylpolyglutamate synthase [Sphingobacteriales bacterium]